MSDNNIHPTDIIVGSTIELPSSRFTLALSEELRYKNPKIAELKRLNLSTYGVPESIPTYWRGPERVSIMRGEMRKVLRHLGPATITERSVTGPSTGIEYCNRDFALDERQQRALTAIGSKKQGIIHAATSAGKSAIILAAAALRQVPTLIIVNRKILLDQLYADARRWITSPKGENLLGKIGSGKCELDRPITFAIDKSLSKLLREQPHLKNAWGCVIVDECHLAPSNTFLNILNQINARYRYGLTGTLKRKDGMEFLIYASFGEVIATITKQELLAAERVSPVEVQVVPTEATVPEEMLELPVTRRTQVIDGHLHADEARNNLIVEYAEKILKERPDARIVVASRYVDPCYRIQKLLDRNGCRAGTITGSDNNSGEVCAGLRSGRLPIVAATLGCFSTGVNVPELTDIILISPCFSNELLIHQLRGRLMRKAEGKTYGTMHVLWDQYVFAPYRLNNFLRIMNK